MSVSCSKWKFVRLGELAEFRNGVNYNRDSFGAGVKVVGVKDFQNYSKPRYETLEQINPDGVVTSKSILKDGDIIFVRSNGNPELIGRSLLIDNPPEEVTHSAFTIRLRFHSPDIYPKFFAYFFRTTAIRKGLTAYGGGTNISNLNQDILNDLKIPLPDLPTQRRIAGILSAYDDLIENNLRRIRILEEMAQSLYREWFVHFRFPGHESVPLTDSPLGPIPQGWRVGQLQDIAVLQRGFDLPKGKRMEGEVPIYAASGITGYHVEAKVKAPGIVTGRSGTIGEVMYVQEDFWPLNTALWVKQLPESEPLYAYYYLRSVDLKGFNSGAAVPTLNRNDVHGLAALVPSKAVQTKFQVIAERLHLQLRTLQSKNETLRQTRDLLLPKLLSGA